MVRPLYFAMLISHILLAFVTLPLVILTLIPVFRGRWDRHRRIARWTIPIWLYVSVTGVLVYLMLYKWFPPPNLALAH
jgi:putative membrane protein